MVASSVMTIRALFVAILASTALAACGHGPGGKLPVDSPLVQYKAPDISDITGIDEDDAPEAGSAAPAAGSAAPTK